MKEQREAVLLGGAGALAGAWKYYVRPELNAKRGWLGVAALVTAYELACPQGETLSEGIDRALEARRALTIAAIGVTAAHLCNALPTRVDPFTVVLGMVKR